MPRNNFAAAERQEFEQLAKRVAPELRERAARGEGPGQLQKECYKKLGLSGLPPATDAGNRRRASVPAEASDEITREIARQKLERALKSITSSIRAELNETYFGPDSGQ